MPRRRSGTVSALSRAHTHAVLNHRLPNGLRVVLCPRESLTQAYVAVFFGVGSRHETPATNGITHVLEHMLFRGTRSFGDATALNTAAEDFGGYLEGATYRDHLLFATGCHPSAIGDAVAILGELVQWPRYRGMDVEKQILREELLETIDQKGRMIDLDNLTHRAVFGTRGLGMPIEGDLATLERLGKRELEAHRRRFLVAENAVVSLAGPFDPELALKAVKKAFSGLAAGTPASPEVPPAARQEPLVRYVRDPGSQVDLRLAFRGVPVQDPEYPALVLLARLLADGLSSRMNAELIDRRGLAYALHAGLTTYADCGLFDFEISVAPDKAAAAVQALLGFAAAAQRFRYTRDEIARSLRRYQYSLEFMGDAAADLASWYGRAALFSVEREMQELLSRIAAVSVPELHAAARKVFRREGLTLTAVGELALGEWAKVKRAVERW